MLKQEKERAIILGGRTEQSLQDAINDALDAHEGARLVNVDLANLRAYIQYTETWTEAETLRDEYVIRGIRPVCGECQYYKAPADRRRRCGECYRATGVDPRDEVCEEFYEWLRDGEVRWEKKGGSR